MKKRFPFRTALAGLTAFAVVTPAVVVPINNTVIAASIAQAAEAVTVSGEGTVEIKQSATFTATVPGAIAGKVQFFLDGVLVATSDVNSEGVATASITPKSYGEHTLTSRYLTTKDGQDYTVNPDGTSTFTTPFPTKFDKDGSGKTGTDVDTYDRFTINKHVSSIDNPIELQPGETYTLGGRMTTTSTGNTRVYEVGFNPSPGSTYVDGSAARYHADSDDVDTSVVVKTRADENGVTTTETDGGFYPSGWGQTTDGQTWPTVNEGYVGLQHTGSYNSWRGTSWELGANFIAPDVPGIHVPQYAAYKYRSSLHALVPMNEAAFKIPPKELPPRNDLPAEQTTLTVAADKNKVTEGTASKLTATVTPDNAAGTVQFKNNGENIGSPVTVANGKAELTQTLPLGTNEVTAEFTPDNPAAFTAATAGATTVTVEKAPTEPSPTTTEPSTEPTSETPTTTSKETEPSPTTTEPSTEPTSETPTTTSKETEPSPTTTEPNTEPTSETPTTTSKQTEPSPTTTEPSTEPSTEPTPETPTTTSESQPDEQKDKDKYQPEVDGSVKPEVHENGPLPEPKDVIGNVDKLPHDTTMNWTKRPTQADPVGEITVTYPDGSTDKVEVEFTVKPPKSDSQADLSSEKPWIFGVIAASVALLLGVIAIAVGNTPPVRNLFEQQFGIRL